MEIVPPLSVISRLLLPERIAEEHAHVSSCTGGVRTGRSWDNGWVALDVEVETEAVFTLGAVGGALGG